MCTRYIFELQSEKYNNNAAMSLWWQTQEKTMLQNKKTGLFAGTLISLSMAISSIACAEEGPIRISYIETALRSLCQRR